MPVAYNPRHFYRVACNAPWRGTSSLYLALWRTICLMPVSVALSIVDYYGYLDGWAEDAGQWNVLLTPFTLLLGLVTAFRLQDAFHKWERAGEVMYTLQREARVVISRLCCFLPANEPSVKPIVLEIRRLLLLGCVLMKSHVRFEKSGTLDECVTLGLLTSEERERLTMTVTVSSGPGGDGKKDKYPTRARPTFAFQKASLLNHTLFRSGHFSCPHAFWGIETAITTMADQFETVEHLGTSLLPLPYAQLTRLLSLIFLLTLPLAYVRSLGLMMPFLSLVANFVLFLIDECSGQVRASVRVCVCVRGATDGV